MFHSLLSSFSCWQDGGVHYSLYGVLVHSGYSTHSGHYYCYVRTSNNMWYTLDDNWVLKMSISFDPYSLVNCVIIGINFINRYTLK